MHLSAVVIWEYERSQAAGYQAQSLVAGCYMRVYGNPQV